MNQKVLTHREQLTQIKNLIETRDAFLITTHVHPDGDSMASVLLFSALLRHFGKKHCIVVDDNVPRKFDFLPGVERIRTFEGFACPFEAEAVVVLDASTLQRIGRVRDLIRPGQEIVHLDHHPESECLGRYRVADTDESSTAELVYYLAHVCGLPVTPEIATLVYTGILCDTGRFQFPNTTHRSLAIGADMVRHGASPGRIAERIYFRNSPRTLRALADALSTLEFHFGGAVACMHLNHDTWKDEEKPDTEGFIDLLLTVEGTEVEFFMLKIKEDLFKVSFRSKTYVDVNEVAKRFGGGGHARASGCYVAGDEPQVKRRILRALESHVRAPAVPSPAPGGAVPAE
jgi:phosphoesterase RecJ-like protein